MKKSDQYVLFTTITLVILLGISFLLYVEKRFSPPQIVKVEPTSSSFVIIHISGAVRNPGVYKLSRGSRVYEAISKAGGSIGMADLDALNLAEVLNDGEKIVVPVKNTNLTTIGSIKNKLDINIMDKEELKRLPGVGEKLADRIVKYRSIHGPFKNLDDLKNVNGIGEKKLREIKQYMKSH